MKNDLLEPEPLENWTKYRLQVQGRQVEAWFINGVFIYEWGILQPDEVDHYTKI